MKYPSIILILFVSIQLFSQTNHRDSINVVHYDLHIKITQLSQKEISGVANILVAPTQANSSAFGLDLQRLVVDSLKVNGQIVSHNHQNDILRFTTEQSYSDTDTLSVEVYYQGTPGKDPGGWGGFYFAGNQAFNMGVGMSVNPHVYGRAWYPCNDSFTDKATYDFFITTQPDYEAICGGINISDTLDSQNNRVWHWKIEQPISTYLTSVAVGDFEQVHFNYSGIECEIPIDIYCSASQVGSVTTAFADVPDMMQIYENHFGPYPFSRVGYSVVNFTSGAMEHVGNIAYPNNAISTALSDQTLMAHELSHMWFGNSVTCATAEDMWLNEGWASYCEALYVEGKHGYEAGKAYSLSNHTFVIQRAHVNDNGFLALYGIGHENTYGSTVYKKGADVARTLRGYLGDSTFFAVLKLWFAENEFTSKDTYEFRDFLSAKTGVDMNPFFDTWVFNAGFPHYEISDFEFDGTQATVEIAQKSIARQFMGNANRVEVTFFNSERDTATRLIQFDGALGTASFTLPFEPEFVIPDYYCRLADATIKTEKVVSGSQQSFSGLNLVVYPPLTNDSAWIHVAYNYSKPENYGQMVGDIELTPLNYWKVDMIPYGDFKGRARFTRQISNNPIDSTFSAQMNDSVKLMYRASVSEDWTCIPTVFNLTWGNVAITIDSLMVGEYALGIKRYQVDVPSIIPQKCEIAIVPNPVKSVVSFIFGQTICSRIDVFNLDGALMTQIEVRNNTQEMLDVSGLSAGTYVAQFYNNGVSLGSEKFLIVR